MGFLGGGASTKSGVRDLAPLGPRQSTARDVKSGRDRAADPSLRFALVVLPDELNECANRHARGAESEVTLTALGLRDDVVGRCRLTLSNPR
jgi:hypothetical protein